MASVTLVVQDNITSSIKRIQTALARIPAEAHKEFVKATPIKTGNARRNTRLAGNEIQANYAYAEKLDGGSSRQAPNGMTVPTEKFIEDRTAQILKRK